MGPTVILGMQQHLWGVQSRIGQAAEVGKALCDASHPAVLIVMADNYGHELEAKLAESGGVWVRGASQDPPADFDVPEGTTLVVVSKGVADGWMKFL